MHQVVRFKRDPVFHSSVHKKFYLRKDKWCSKILPRVHTDPPTLCRHWFTHSHALKFLIPCQLCTLPTVQQGVRL